MIVWKRKPEPKILYLLAARAQVIIGVGFATLFACVVWTRLTGEKKIGKN